MSTFKVTDPRAYLADVLAKAEAVDEFHGNWEWRESTPGLGNLYHQQNGLLGEYNLPGCGRCGSSDQVFESFVGEFIASARTTSPAMARALIAVVELHEPTDYPVGHPYCAHCSGDNAPDFDRVEWPCETYRIITTELAKEIEHG